MYGLKCMISSIQSNFSRTRYMNQNISLLILLLSHFCSLYHNIICIRHIYLSSLSPCICLFVCLRVCLSVSFVHCFALMDSLSIFKYSSSAANSTGFHNTRLHQIILFRAGKLCSICRNAYGKLVTCKECLIGSIGDQDLLVGVDGVANVQQLRVEAGDGVDQPRMTLNQGFGSKTNYLYTSQTIPLPNSIEDKFQNLNYFIQ